MAYIYLSVYIYVTIIIKEVMNLRESRGPWEELEWGERRLNDVNTVLMKFSEKKIN